MSIKTKVRRCSKSSLCITLPAQIAKMYGLDDGSKAAPEAMGAIACCSGVGNTCLPGSPSNGETSGFCSNPGV